LIGGSVLTAGKYVVFNIDRMTVHNGPGLRTVVYLKGCPLRCLWCSTPESQKPHPEIAIYPDRCTHCGYCAPVCPLHAIKLTKETISINRAQCDNCGKCAEVCYPEALKLLGQVMTVEELLEEVKKDIVFYKQSGGGVTVSGGEPLLAPEFLKRFLSACREEGISAGIDTCGHVPWENIEQVLPYVDFFLWDIKHMDPVKHREFTGVTNELILSNARALSKVGIPLYIRVPVIPGYTDSDRNIKAICKFALELPSVVRVDLLFMHHLGKARYDSLNRVYPIADVPTIPNDVLQRMKLLVESYGLRCSIGG
jgi:pyruvate formate lyase activating enzyme